MATGYQKLKGKRILVTRPRNQARKLVDKLRKAGAKVIHIPLIEITDPSDNFRSLDRAISRLDKYDWIIFTSRNAVSMFFQRLSLRARPARYAFACPLAELARQAGVAMAGGRAKQSPSPQPSPSRGEACPERSRRGEGGGGHGIASSQSTQNLSARLLAMTKKFAAVGPTTTAALKKHGIRNVIVPRKDNYSADGLVDVLKKYDFKGKRVLFPSAKKVKEILPSWLKKQGAKLDKVEAYQTVMPKNIDRTRIKRLIKGNKVDTVLFYSESAEKNFIRVVGQKLAKKYRPSGLCESITGPWIQRNLSPK